jgi:hypothetical protein
LRYAVGRSGAATYSSCYWRTGTAHARQGSGSYTELEYEWAAARSDMPIDRATLAQEVIATLRSRPYLIVLDGFERLLTAYHRFDPSKVQDHAVEIHERSLIEANADDIVRRLAAVTPSKVLASPA